MRSSGRRSTPACGDAIHGNSPVAITTRSEKSEYRRSLNMFTPVNGSPGAAAGASLVDRRRGGGARHLVLRAGAAGAADGTDDLAVLDQGDAATRGDDIVKRQHVVVARLLYCVFEGLGRPPKLHRGARLVFRDGDRGKLGAIHAHEGDQIGPGVHHGDVELPA